MVLKLLLAYDGCRFKGWQKGNGRTVQGELERALLGALPRASGGAVKPGSWSADDLRLVGAGRTDAGVHAEAQAASCAVPDAVDAVLLAEAVNGALPEDLALRSCERAEDRFHARYRATSKLYRYRIVDGPVGDPFLAPYSWRVPERLDEGAMAAAAAALAGRHDFTSLTADKSKKDRMRTLDSVLVRREGPPGGGAPLVLEFRAESFLWNQVRIMAALLAEAGRGRMDAAGISALIEARDRARAPAPAPAKGLCLVSVSYS